MWWNPYWGKIPLSASRLSARKMAEWGNSQEFLNAYQKYFTLAQDIFGWRNLPATIDERMIERSLLLTGRVLIAEVDGVPIALAGADGANINVNGYPLTGWGWGFNGFNREFRLYVPGADDGNVLTQTASGLNLTYPKPEAVMGYDNVDGYPMVNYIVVAARRLADLIRSCDVVVAGLKSPYLITCDETQVKTVEEAMRRRQNNEIAIIASKMSVTDDMFHVWPTEISPDTLRTFWEQYRNVEAELLETLGINSNDNTDKRERLLVDEINSNNEEIGGQLSKRYSQRKLLADRVNATFGLNIQPYIKRTEYREQGITDDTGRVSGNDGDTG